MYEVERRRATGGDHEQRGFGRSDRLGQSRRGVRVRRDGGETLQGRRAEAIGVPRGRDSRPCGIARPARAHCLRRPADRRSLGRDDEPSGWAYLCRRRRPDLRPEYLEAMAILQLRLHSHAAPQLGSLKAKLAANIRQAMILGEPVATRCRPVSPGCRKLAAYAMAIFTLRTFSDPRAMRPSS